MVGGFVYIGWQINLNPKQVWGGFMGGGFLSRDGVVGGLTDGAPQCAFGEIGLINGRLSALGYEQQSKVQNLSRLWI